MTMHRRQTFRPALAVAIVAALLAYVGCTGSSNPPSARVEPSKSGAPAAKGADAGSSVRPSFKTEPDTVPLTTWRETPTAVILVSGEQLGYLEPCGCTQGQLGGLLRRYDLVRRIADREKWPMVAVDLGSLVKDPNAARGGAEQAKLKFQIALKALAVMKYDALALSPEDLKVGVDEAVGQFLNLPKDAPRIVAANVAAAGLESRVVPSVRAKAGPASIGITAVVDPERLQALKDPALDLLTIRPIDDALPAVLADLEKDTAVQVLLVQAAPEVAKALAAKYTGFDVVVSTSLLPDPSKDAETLNGGKTLLVTVGQKGKYAGLVGIFDDKASPLRYQRITLGNQFKGPAKAMKDVVEDEYRRTLKDQGVAARFPKHDDVNAPPHARFVGVDACKACHPNTFARWAGTKHALAYQSLEKDPKPNTVFDAECLTCHTTGFEFTSGYRSASATPLLRGNQCENCHGPASRHVESPDETAARSAMHLTAELADKNRLCLRCHDEDNSPHFDFAKYYGQIVHKGLDEYKDPKVHQGAPARAAGSASEESRR
jgi:hypothetical protein